MAGFNYKEYLASREWAVKRRAVLERAAGGCERCSVYDVAAVHHVTYERIGRERLEDLLAVCKGCHAYLSGVSDLDPVVEIPRSQDEFSRRLDEGR